MSQPRPESRISSLEQRASTIEAQIIEMSADTAEELKAIRQEIKQGHIEIGQALDSHANTLTQKLDAIEASMVTKDDLKQELEAFETRLLAKFAQLLQQKPRSPSTLPHCWPATTISPDG